MDAKSQLWHTDNGGPQTVTFDSTPDGVYRVFAELNQGSGANWGEVRAKLRVMLDGCGAYSMRRFLLLVGLCVCVCVYGVYVCMHGCEAYLVRRFVLMVCLCSSLCLCMYICMYVCMYVCINSMTVGYMS